MQIDKNAKELELKRLGKGANSAPLMEYLNTHPTVDGIFTAWDTAHKVRHGRAGQSALAHLRTLTTPPPQSNNSQLSAVVLSTLTSLLRLISSAPHPSEPEIVRRLLGQYGQHLDRALNPGRNDVTTAALRLACVVVAFAGGRFAKRLWSCFSWSTKVSPRARLP